MIFVCERTGCHFAFESEEEPERCPECGGQEIHIASSEEERQYHMNIYERDR